MSDKVPLVRVLTSATGNSTPITLGVAYSQLFMTPTEAGAIDGRTYTWLIVDGNNWELVKGVYTASGTTAARTTVLASRISGTLGTSRITLSGTAQVRIVEAAVDMDGVRGTRAVSGMSDVLAATDLGYVVTYSNASAVAVSLAQAGTASLYDGWATWVQNLGAGTVTITPATSTINGNATLPLATNMGAFIWSDGTNYHAYFIPVSKPLLAANNLADVASATTSLSNLGGAAKASNLSDLASVATARTNLSAIGSPQCGRLAYSSATALTFTPYNGADLKINGAIVQIPPGGISGLANTSVFVNGTGASNLAANTLYYVYAFSNSGTVTADFSTTGHATSSTAGNVGTEIKSGADTRTLIGMIQTNASAQFTQGGTASWFNRRFIYQVLSLGNLSTTSTSNVYLSGSLVGGMVWSDETTLSAVVEGQAATSGSFAQIFVSIDSAGAAFGSQQFVFGTSVFSPACIGGFGSAAEGYHTFGASGSAASGSGTLTLNNTTLAAVFRG